MEYKGIQPKMSLCQTHLCMRKKKMEDENEGNNNNEQLKEVSSSRYDKTRTTKSS